MTDRARLSRLESWLKSTPPGAEFLGSADFPSKLVEVVEKYDPAGMLSGEVVKARGDDFFNRDPTDEEKARLRSLMEKMLRGKRILNMAGGEDRLVPYKCSEPFLRWLKNAIARDGFFADGDVVLKDVVFEGVGHEMSPPMVEEAHRFVVETLEQSATESIERYSKI